ncbi:hypothetical protein QCN29_12640 [Streptomyces sp. HNM0663]|uniref:Uncharacterized protein n=1 Tax=Streptomyces chengmaiensis TaxID=3040919 RepID=A0ABT6HLL9_9ACTN|nr:hypothetical protein [Streptomyces chengmaiensis]MDH2389625.1 hypothetical protein [Streptomyces chengmaiensis]
MSSSTTDHWAEACSAARDESGYTGPDVPFTPDGVGRALTKERRTEFYNALARVSGGEHFDGLMFLWWPRALIASARPGEEDAAMDYADLALAHYVKAKPQPKKTYTHAEAMEELGLAR